MKRLLREWAALLAVFAMVLGPLALATSRGLGAAEKVAVAAGLKPLVQCLPGDDGSDPANHPLAGDCDHCTVVQPFLPVSMSGQSVEMLQRSLEVVLLSLPICHAFPRAPPARGPPAA